MSEAKIILAGATGRMGKEIATVVGETDGVALGPAITRDSAPTNFNAGAVIIDFSSPAGFDRALQIAVDARVGFVSGTTGLSEDQFGALSAAAERIPVLWAANFSRGVNVLEHLVELGARALGDFDAEIFEAHHRHKVDAPSGTALYLAEAAARGRKQNLDEVATWTRHGAAGPRTKAEIGFQVVRGGSIVGEHTVFLCGDGERVELTHRAQERAIFARGAVAAAQWLVGAAPGQYTMKDVLFG